jgi:hypothetical protein
MLDKYDNVIDAAYKVLWEPNIVNREIINWFYEHKTVWGMIECGSDTYIVFDDDEDAVAFKLKWL